MKAKYMGVSVPRERSQLCPVLRQDDLGRDTWSPLGTWTRAASLDEEAEGGMEAEGYAEASCGVALRFQLFREFDLDLLDKPLP